jgi:hypothetical protein
MSYSVSMQANPSGRSHEVNILLFMSTAVTSCSGPLTPTVGPTYCIMCLHMQISSAQHRHHSFLAKQPSTVDHCCACSIVPDSAAARPRPQQLPKVLMQETPRKPAFAAACNNST